MKNAQARKHFGMACLAGMMVFCAGMLAGQVGGERVERPVDGGAVAVFAEGTTDAIGTQAETPRQEPENWFFIEPESPEVEEATEAPETPETLVEISLTPEPAATMEPGFQLELVREETEESALPEGRAKRILLYHTHTYEAYEQTEDAPYQETQQWRTADDAHNVVSVGEELAALLRSMGVEVVHDTTAFEPPDLNTSYTRSLEMLERRRELGESYDLYIDLHRDAYVASQSGPNTVPIGNGQAAKLMMLIGKGEGQTGEGFEEKPPWEENLAIAQRLTSELNAELPGLCKEVRMKSGRFNQHIAVGCILVEVGNNRNTLAEAKAAMPYLADAINAYLSAGK